jgi:signal transduction histidine kinase
LVGNLPPIFLLVGKKFGMLKKINISICLFVLIIMSADTHSQAVEVKGYSLQHFTDENGLPQNSVKSIVPDDNGFIWLATEGGLVRYDGKAFYTFSKKNSDIPSIRMMSILPSIHEHELMVVTNDLEILSIKKGNVTYPVSAVPWGYQTVLDLYYNDRLETHIKLGEPTYNAAPFRLSRLILVKDPQSFYICTDTVVEYLERNRRISIPFLVKPSSVFFILDGILYCHQPGGDFVRFDKGHPVHFKVNDLPTNGNEKPLIYWQSISRTTYYYINKTLYRLIRMADNTIEAEKIMEGFALDAHSIKCIYADSETGHVFLGSDIEGLYFFKKKEFDVLKTETSKRDDSFYAHTYFGNNSVLSSQGYILGPKQKPRLMHSIHEVSTDRYGIVLAKHGRKSIWTKGEKTLYEFDINGNAINHWAFDCLLHVLYEDNSGILWIGTRTEGLYRLDLNDPKAKPELFVNLPSCTYILQNNDDYLWTGSVKGLYKINLKNKSVDFVDGLKGVYVRSLFADNSSELWGTSYDDGMFFIREGKVYKLPLDKNQYLGSAHCILKDKKENFWISTNKGIFLVPKQDLLDYAEGKSSDVYYFYYGKESGFSTNEFNGGCEPCGVDWGNGTFSFPSLEGIVYFNPDDIHPEFPDDEIFFHEIELDGKLIPLSDTLNITNDFQRLTFTVTAPYWGNANNLRLEGSLQGVAGNSFWTGLGDDHSISFTTLPYGTYRFVLRKPKGFGVDNYIYKTVVIIVPPAYWQTWWFVTGATLLFVFVVYYGFRYRIRYIIRKNMELEEIVSERTHDLVETVSELRQSRALLRQRAQLQQNIILAFSHDLKSPLLYLMITGQKLHENLKSVPGKFADSAQVIYNSTFNMYHFTDNFLNYAKLYFMAEKPTTENVVIHELILEKIKIFKYIAESKNIEIKNNVSPHLAVNTNAMLLSIVLHNLLDNATKYTDEGLIEFSSKENDEAIEINITDTGMGINDEVKRQYADLFHIAMDEVYVNDAAGKGLGLQMVKELITIIGAQMWIESEEEKGTSVNIVFKKDKLG